MAHVLSRRLLTAEARDPSQTSPCGICGGQSSIGTGGFPSNSIFPCQCHSNRHSILIYSSGPGPI
jgi:hypothetical protein